MLRTQPTHLLMGILVCCGLLSNTARAQVIVHMKTNEGDIDIELYDEAAPITVTNFLNYVNDGDYNNSFIHRSAAVPHIIQGGGFRNIGGITLVVPVDPPIVNEYDAARPNTRGTIAMARTADLNSATSGWFFNISDNSGTLDGPYAVFGRIIGSNNDIDTTNDGDSMAVVDSIAALSKINCGGPFTDVPIIGAANCANIVPSQDLVTIESVMTLIPAAPATLSNVAFGADNPSPTNAPADVSFEEGFFSFQIDNIGFGGSAMVAMGLPTSYRPNTYYMYGPTPDNHTPHWYEFNFDGRTGAEFFGSNYVVLNFVDGERGDADLTVNGQISDPGAPGISTATRPIPVSGGGGCTLSANAGRSPMAIDLPLLTLGILGLGWLRERSRKIWRTAITARCVAGYRSTCT